MKKYLVVIVLVGICVSMFHGEIVKQEKVRYTSPKQQQLTPAEEKKVRNTEEEWDTIVNSSDPRSYEGDIVTWKLYYGYIPDDGENNLMCFVNGNKNKWVSVLGIPEEQHKKLDSEHHGHWFLVTGKIKYGMSSYIVVKCIKFKNLD